jgi:hypothetical protein
MPASSESFSHKNGETGLESAHCGRAYLRDEKVRIICPECGAGYRRIEVASGNGTKGDFRCLLCNHVLEIFDGSAEIAIRLTIQPEKIWR